MWFLILFIFEIFSRWCRVCMPEVSKNATDSSYYSWSLWTCFNSMSKFELMSTMSFFYFNSTFVLDVWSSQVIKKKKSTFRWEQINLAIWGQKGHFTGCLCCQTSNRGAILVAETKTVRNKEWHHLSFNCYIIIASYYSPTCSAKPN